MCIRDRYQAALRRLEAQGLVYPCFCTRAELHAASAPHREDGQVVYPGTCRGLTAEQAAERARRTGRAPALRLWVPEEEITFTDGHMGEYREWLPADCGDFLLQRSDGIFAYQLAVVVDDAEMGVTQVVRGSDLLSSTPRQIWLLEQLGGAYEGYREKFLEDWAKEQYDPWGCWYIPECIMDIEGEYHPDEAKEQEGHDHEESNRA